MMMKHANFSAAKALEEQFADSSRFADVVRNQLSGGCHGNAATQKLIIGEHEMNEDFKSQSQIKPQIIGSFAKIASNRSHFGLIFESFRSDLVAGVSLINAPHVVEWSSKCLNLQNSTLIFIVAAISRDLPDNANVAVSFCEGTILHMKLPPVPKSSDWQGSMKKDKTHLVEIRSELDDLSSKLIRETALRLLFKSPDLLILPSPSPFDFATNSPFLEVKNATLDDFYGQTMSYDVALTAVGIFLLIAILVALYFRIFSRLIIEIVDNRHSFGTDPNVSNFVQNAVLFAYRPIFETREGAKVATNTPHLETGQPVEEPKVAPAPSRPFLGILGTPANLFAIKHGVRVISLCRYVYQPPENQPPAEPKYRNPNDDDSDPENIDAAEASPLSTATGGDDLDMTKAALGAFQSGDSRYVVGVVVSEAADESQLTYPSPLCEQLRAAGFTRFCVLPPLRTALRLRYAAGRNWRKSILSRMAVAMAGMRFYGSSREVIRQYRLRPPHSPLIVEFYDPNSVIFYLPLADEIDLVDSRYLTSRLPPELTCPRPPPPPLPEGGLLGAPPLPYKNMNAILRPWDPYSNEDPRQEKKSKNSMERV